ncbi:MAG: glutamate--cysteine ligase [Balneolaceae bacterium]|nr:MAG: glutamate--cysteine ligase [Balneolaceae bacterium]
MNSLVAINKKRPLSLFEGYGVELEYMIVDDKTLNVLPISDRLLEQVAGSIVSEYPVNSMAWSNELALHVIEIKTNGAASALEPLNVAFQDQIDAIESILHQFDARLMPGAMHPWMNPFSEIKLWPHEYNPIYEAYNRIFDCHGHGWANLQSTHLNLPFHGDEEFAKLHAAARIVLSLIPAMAASSPIADGERKPFLDFRMETYRTNSLRIPSITGNIIPEPVFTRKDYNREIFQRMYRDISSFDPDGILQDEWLNSRGAMSRWDRETIEIRVIDIQEFPGADIAILEWIVNLTKALVDEKWSAADQQKSWSDTDLFRILMDVVTHGEKAVIKNESFLRLFGASGSEITAGELCEHIFLDVLKDYPFSEESVKHIELIFNQGPLARRILDSLPVGFSRNHLFDVYLTLCDCLRNGKAFGS